MLIYIRLCKGRSIYDRLIRWYSRSPYSHAEFAWPLTKRNPREWLGAQPRGGVQVRPANYLGAVPYDVFALEVSQSQARRLERFLLDQVGKPYDWRAIINMGVFQHDVSTWSKWFCSELVFGALAKVGAWILRAPLLQRDRITPRDVGTSVMLDYVASYPEGSR